MAENGDDPCPTGKDDIEPVLKDVVALVEVRTKTENRSRGVEYQLEQLGAKVVSKLSPDVTHVIWKNGKKPTLDRARKRGIHVVTVLWVESCKQNQEQVAESMFPVINKDDGSPLFIPNSRRRKFMEPKDLEEDLRDSRERLAKRRKKDVPSPISLTGRVLVKDTPHCQSPTWYLPGPPFSPSLIPHTPDSMRKCLDKLSAAKNRTPSNPQRPCLGDSPTFDTAGSGHSSPLEKPQVVGSLIERLLYSDNDEPSPLEKIAFKYDVEKSKAEGNRPSLSKALFPTVTAEDSDATCVSPAQGMSGKGSRKLSRRRSQNKPPSIGERRKSRRSSKLGRHSNQSKSPEEERTQSAENVGLSPGEVCAGTEVMGGRAANPNGRTIIRDATNSTVHSQETTPSTLGTEKKAGDDRIMLLSPEERILREGQTIIRDITNSPAQSPAIASANGKDVRVGKQLSRKPKRRTSRSKPEVIETILLDSPEEILSDQKTSRANKMQPGCSGGVDWLVDREQATRVERVQCGERGLESVEKKHGDASTQKGKRTSNSFGHKKRQSKSLGRVDELGDDQGEDTTVDGVQCKRSEVGSSERQHRGITKKDLQTPKDDDTTISNNVKTSLNASTKKHSTEGKVPASAGSDSLKSKLTSTPGQKRLMREDHGGEEPPKRRTKRRKLLNMQQSYEDPPSVLIEPRETKRGDQSAILAEQDAAGMGCTAGGDASCRGKAGKRLSNRLRKVSDVKPSSQPDPALALIEPSRRSLEDFRGDNKGSTKTAEETKHTTPTDVKKRSKSVTIGHRVTNKKPTIVMTSMHKSEQEIVVSVIRNLGGFKITDTVNEGTTHVVTGDNRRTLNVLSAIAHGAWLVSKEWVLNSLESGKWLPEEPFEVHNTFPAARLSRELKKESSDGSRHIDLFSEHGDIFVSESSSPPRERLCDLIQLCGGTLCKNQRQADLCIGASTGRTGMTTVQEKWVLDCITELRSLPLEGYKMSD